MAKPAGRGSSSVGGFTAAALAAVPAAELIRVGGFDRKEADWLLRVARGEDPDPVVANADEGPKSVCAFKSFQSTDDPDRVARWLGVLSKELAVGSRRTGGSTGGAARAQARVPPRPLGGRVEGAVYAVPAVCRQGSPRRLGL